MKIAKNVDDSSKMKLPSMKTAKNVDGKFKNQIPSMKIAYHVRHANMTVHKSVFCKLLKVR